MLKNDFNEIKLLAQYPYQSDASVFIDVGAQKGNASIIFARKEWCVFAFEPEPDNYSRLQKRFKNFENVTCIEKCVSNLS